MTGIIKDGSKLKKFAINILDTPWDFPDYNLIKNNDIYFKCQYPKNFNEGHAYINQHNSIEINEDIMNESYKIKPLMLGRPLCRGLNFKKNIKILERYDIIRKKTARKNKILIYLGMAYDDIDIKNSHHPHLKRANISVWSKENLPNAHIILKISNQNKFSNVLTNEVKKIASNEYITDRKYIKLISDSYSTLNITGLRGSIPFRVIDSYLSGMVLISDYMHVDWYEPLIAGKDYLNIGNLGYELMENIDFNNSCDTLKKYVDDIENIYISTIDYRENKYYKYYSPESVAMHIINELNF
jgi:hypothetical protein